MATFKRPFKFDEPHEIRSGWIEEKMIAKTHRLNDVSMDERDDIYFGCVIR